MFIHLYVIKNGRIEIQVFTWPVLQPEDECRSHHDTAQVPADTRPASHRVVSPSHPLRCRATEYPLSPLGHRRRSSVMNQPSMELLERPFVALSYKAYIPRAESNLAIGKIENT